MLIRLFIIKVLIGIYKNLFPQYFWILSYVLDICTQRKTFGCNIVSSNPFLFNYNIFFIVSNKICSNYFMKSSKPNIWLQLLNQLLSATVSSAKTTYIIYYNYNSFN